MTIGATVIFATLAGAAVLLAPARYNATSVLVVQDPGASQLFENTAALSPDRYVQDQVAILQSNSVARRAIELAGATDPEAAIEIEELVDHAQIVSNRSSNVIEVIYTDSDRELSLVFANSIAEAYQEVRRTEALASIVRAIEELDSSVSVLDGEIEAVQAEIEELRFGHPSRTELFRQYEEALGRLAELQQELTLAEGETQRDVVRAQLADVTQQLQTLQLVLNLDVERPEILALLGRLEEATDLRSDLAARGAQLEVDAELASGVALYFPASAAETAGLPLAVAVLGGALAGLLVGIAVSFLLAGRRQIIDSRLIPREILSAPLLAEIPDFREERLKTELPVFAAPRSVAAEAFRFAAAALELRGNEGSAGSSELSDNLFAGPKQASNVVVVVSAEEGDGKSVVVANTALASCWTGNRVLVIDADFGSQSQARLFQQRDMEHVGLAEVIAGEMSLQSAARTVELSFELRLDLLTRGRIPLSATDLLRSKEAEAFFSSVADNYDLVVIDSPPLLRVAYATILCRHSDRAVVVVPHGSDADTLESLSDRLGMVGTDVTGYVYNRAPLDHDQGIYGGSLQDVVGTGPEDTSETHQAKHRR